MKVNNINVTDFAEDMIEAIMNVNQYISTTLDKKGYTYSDNINFSELEEILETNEDVTPEIENKLGKFIVKYEIRKITKSDKKI